MKSKITVIDGIDYLSFQPEENEFQITIPVITKGSRSLANAWTWNGSLEAPTLRPSVRTEYPKEGKMVVIHYWLTDGICQCLSDCTDGNSGKNIPLAELHS